MAVLLLNEIKRHRYAFAAILDLLVVFLGARIIALVAANMPAPDEQPLILIVLVIVRQGGQQLLRFIQGDQRLIKVADVVVNDALLDFQSRLDFRREF